MVGVTEAVEPMYCICQGPSDGNMVACDNEDCEVEWFHFECMGLQEHPTGEWFCPTCTKAQTKKEKQSAKAR